MGLIFLEYISNIINVMTHLNKFSFQPILASCTALNMTRLFVNKFSLTKSSQFCFSRKESSQLSVTLYHFHLVF